MPAATLTLDTNRLERAIRDFTAGTLPRVAQALARETLADVAEETSKGVSGSTGLIRRVDTHRYINAWNLAAARAGRTVGPTAAAKPGDVTYVGPPKNLRSLGRIRINVPYAEYLETGTSSMQAGNHLARAMYLVNKRLAAKVKAAVAKAAK